MSAISPTVQAAGMLLQNPLAIQDETARRMIIDWGYRQIEEEYPLNALKSPLNVMRRKLAQMEWNQVIQTNGRELRAVVAGSAVEELNFQLERRRQQIIADDLERQRREEELFNQAQRMKEKDHDSAQAFSQEKALLELKHKQSQEAEDAASRRRKEEAEAQTSQDLALLVFKQLLQGLGATSAQQTIEATRLINAEITRIRHDPTLSPDDQHLQIRSLLDTMPVMLRNLRSHDG